MAKDLSEIRSEFIEKVGLQAQNDGLPRIAGRLLGLLIWGGEAVSFGVLADQLQVSRGSISTATRILEERRLVRRTAKPGERQEYFQLSENPYVSMLTATKTGIETSKQEVERTLAEIPDSEADIRMRVASHAAFYERLAKAVDNLVTEMEK